MNDQMCVLLTTLADENEARNMSQMLIDRKLAACTQEFEVNSRFRWNDAIQTETEVVMLVKTAVDRVEATVEAIREAHSYDLPEIIVLSVTGGLQAYMDWVHSETRPK